MGLALAGGPSPGPETVRVLPLPWLNGPCLDPRYPRLAGEWAVGCGPSGRVDRAVHLESRRTVLLEDAAVSPAVAPGVLYAPTRDHGVWRLPGAGTVPDAPLVPQAGIAPAATDGVRVALSVEDGVQLFRLDEKLRRTWPATPAPWYPPAIDGPLVAWVDVASGSEDVLALIGDQVVALAATGRHERHVAVSGTHVAWIDDLGVHGWDSATDQRWSVAADAHTSRRLSLDGDVACWEGWNGVDVDVVCSDGLRWSGPGHQRGPDRQGDWLLVVDQGNALLLDLRGGPGPVP